MSEEDPKSWVYAGGLPFELSEGDIVCVFSQYGEIFQISLARDKDTGKSRGFCFIKYEDTRSCELAVDNLNGAAIVGRKIRVSYPSNLNFVKSRRPAIVAPTEDSTLPQVVPDKRKRDEIDEDDRVKKSSRYDDADRQPRLLNPCYDEEPKRALQYNREERDQESPRRRDDRKYKREDEKKYGREDERKYKTEGEKRHKRDDDWRDIKSSRHHDEDRRRRSSRDRDNDRPERSSRHKDEERSRKSPKHSHRDKDRKSSSRHRDHDKHKKSSRHRDERRSKRSPSYSDDERSPPRHRERHRAEGSSRHR